MDESVLTTNVERTAPTQQTVKGEVAWSEVKAKLDQTFKELSKEVRLKGFRKGKVPRSLLDKMVGKRVRNEVSTQLAREAIAEAIKTHKLRVVAPPNEWDISTEGIAKDQPLKFEVALEVLPKIEPKDYFGLEVPATEITVTDEEVDSFIERQRQQLTQMEPIEDRTEIQRGDIIDCEIMGKLGDEPLDLGAKTILIPAEGESAAENRYPEPLPGLAEALLGQDISAEDCEIELNFDADAPEHYRDKTARLLVSFDSIKKPLVPKLDDEFARDTGMADTLEELRKVVREKLHDAHAERAAEQRKEALLDALCAHNDVELSPRVVEDETQRMRQRLSSAMGLDPAAMSEHGGALDETLRKQAKKQVHRSLLLDAIAEKEEIEISDEELDAHLAEMAEERSTNVPRLKADLQKRNMLESMRLSLREQKTVDLLMERSRATTEANAEEPAEKAEKTAAPDNGETPPKAQADDNEQSPPKEDEE
jgi:trigger factor